MNDTNSTYLSGEWLVEQIIQRFQKAHGDVKAMNLDGLPFQKIIPFKHIDAGVKFRLYRLEKKPGVEFPKGWNIWEIVMLDGNYLTHAHIKIAGLFFGMKGNPAALCINGKYQPFGPGSRADVDEAAPHCFSTNGPLVFLSVLTNQIKDPITNIIDFVTKGVALPKRPLWVDRIYQMNRRRGKHPRRYLEPRLRASIDKPFEPIQPRRPVRKPALPKRLNTHLQRLHIHAKRHLRSCEF